MKWFFNIHGNDAYSGSPGHKLSAVMTSHNAFDFTQITFRHARKTRIFRTKGHWLILLISVQLLWKDIFLLPRSASLNSKIREFQYKVLKRILMQINLSLNWELLIHHCVLFVKHRRNPSSMNWTLSNINCFWLSVGKLLSCNSRFDRCEHNVWTLWKRSATN